MVKKMQSINRPQYQNFIWIALVSTSLMACTTLRSSKAGGPSERSRVVTQAGRQDPIVSQHQRRYWLDVRSNSKSSLAKAEAALATGESAAAVGLARNFLKNRPGDSDALLILASALALERNYDLAAYYAKQVERGSPGHPGALNIRGLAILLAPNNRVKDYQTAATLFREAFGNSEEIAAGMNLGHLALELGDATEAEDVFGEVRRRCNQCNASLLGFGIASSRLQHFDAARKALRAILAKSPSHSRALFHLAIIERNGFGNNKEASKYLEKLLATRNSQNLDLKERAQTVLRVINGEATVGERQSLASDANNSADDAELLMSTFEDE